MPPWKTSLDGMCDALDHAACDANVPDFKERRDEEDVLSATVYSDLPYPENQLVSLAHSLMARGVIDEAELKQRLGVHPRKVRGLDVDGQVARGEGHHHPAGRPMRTKRGAPDCASKSRPTYSKSAHPGSRSTCATTRFANSLMTLTTLDPPVVGFVTMWTQQSYGDQVRAPSARLEKECDDVAAYLVTESVPLPPPTTVPGQRTAGTGERRAAAPTRRSGRGNVASTLAHRPHAGGHRDAVDIRVHPERGGAPADRWARRHFAAIVEELFPIEAISDLHAFFGAADDDDLRDRMERMVASTAAFGANRDVDTVPTSRYVLPNAVRWQRQTRTDDHT